mmetsp:Transcript_13887/g.21013  ORF Transcript_13887/g.21013 Transcript_13887/m.21013 type:complete len:669 (+) Transcript_13887:68-2074(+)
MNRLIKSTRNLNLITTRYRSLTIISKTSYNKMASYKNEYKPINSPPNHHNFSIIRCYSIKNPKENENFNEEKEQEVKRSTFGDKLEGYIKVFIPNTYRANVAIVTVIFLIIIYLRKTEDRTHITELYLDIFNLGIKDNKEIEPLKSYLVFSEALNLELSVTACTLFQCYKTKEFTAVSILSEDEKGMTATDELLNIDTGVILKEKRVPIKNSIDSSSREAVVLDVQYENDLIMKYILIRKPKHCTIISFLEWTEESLYNFDESQKDEIKNLLFSKEEADHFIKSLYTPSTPYSYINSVETYLKSQYLKDISTIYIQPLEMAVKMLTDDVKVLFDQSGTIPDGAISIKNIPKVEEFLIADLMMNFSTRKTEPLENIVKKMEMFQEVNGFFDDKENFEGYFNPKDYDMDKYFVRRLAWMNILVYKYKKPNEIHNASKLYFKSFENDEIFLQALTSRMATEQFPIFIQTYYINLYNKLLQDGSKDGLHQQLWQAKMMYEQLNFGECLRLLKEIEAKSPPPSILGLVYYMIAMIHAQGYIKPKHNLILDYTKSALALGHSSAYYLLAELYEKNEQWKNTVVSLNNMKASIREADNAMVNFKILTIYGLVTLKMLYRFFPISKIFNNPSHPFVDDVIRLSSISLDHNKKYFKPDILDGSTYSYWKSLLFPSHK